MDTNATKNEGIAAKYKRNKPNTPEHCQIHLNTHNYNEIHLDTLKYIQTQLDTSKEPTNYTHSKTPLNKAECIQIQ